MSDWDKELEACFGSVDRIFAGHPSDEKQAFDWLTSLRKRGIGWMAARKQLDAFLKSKDTPQKHREAQLLRARKRFKPWLLD